MQTKQKINEYDQQAIDFLESTGTKLDIVYLYTGKYFHNDEQERDIYQFTLTNDKGSYSAKFGDSLNNTKYNHFVTSKKTCVYKEDRDFCKANNIFVRTNGYISPKSRKRRMPSAYDILACLDTYCPDTFEDFCSEYGYSDQPISEHDNVMRIYMAVKDQAKGLKAIFDDDQLEQLADIN